MEVALHIREAREAGAVIRLGNALGWEYSSKLSNWMDAVITRFAALPIDRYYFGTEFCENLLPSRESVRAMVASGKLITLLTPYVSNSGLRELRELFCLLPEKTEVVFADWGVLQVLRQEFPALTPVQGRLLNKSLRDPRVTGLYAIEGAHNPTLDAMRSSNLDNVSYANLLARFGVTRVEMDQLPQGNSYDLGSVQLKAHVYAPFGFISTARSCLAAGLHYRGADKFQPGAPCRHECQTNLLEYSYTNSPFENRDQKFWLKGNTYFYTHTDAMLDELSAKIESGVVERLVFQPRVPMVES